ncbi:MAG: ankyrin repeat domain-containing protein [Endozoicomonadaceae bacterium]|nr:ankyrin repeat domain-containing protein [Endozoicomonadaceae bacterium]
MLFTHHNERQSLVSQVQAKGYAKNEDMRGSVSMLAPSLSLQEQRIPLSLYHDINHLGQHLNFSTKLRQQQLRSLDVMSSMLLLRKTDEPLESVLVDEPMKSICHLKKILLSGRQLYIISEFLAEIQDSRFYYKLPYIEQCEILLSILYQPASDEISIQFLNSQEAEPNLMASFQSHNDQKNIVIKNKALHLFIEGRFKLLSTLIQKGLNLTACSLFRIFYYHFVVKYNQIHLFPRQKIRSKMMGIRKTDIKRKSILHIALHYRDVNPIMLYKILKLISNDGMISKTDITGRKASDYAKEMDLEKLAQYLCCQEKTIDLSDSDKIIIEEFNACSETLFSTTYCQLAIYTETRTSASKKSVAEWASTIDKIDASFSLEMYKKYMQEINTDFKAEARSIKSRLLLHAIRKNKLAWVRFFIVNGESLANISAANNVDPLHLAILYDHQEIILLLFHVGAVYGLFSKQQSTLAASDMKQSYQMIDPCKEDVFNNNYAYLARHYTTQSAGFITYLGLRRKIQTEKLKITSCVDDSLLQFIQAIHRRDISEIQSILHKNKMKFHKTSIFNSLLNNDEITAILLIIIHNNNENLTEVSTFLTNTMKHHKAYKPLIFHAYQCIIDNTSLKPESICNDGNLYYWSKSHNISALKYYSQPNQQVTYRHTGNNTCLHVIFMRKELIDLDSVAYIISMVHPSQLTTKNDQLLTPLDFLCLKLEKYRYQAISYETLEKLGMQRTIKHTEESKQNPLYQFIFYAMLENSRRNIMMHENIQEPAMKIYPVINTREPEDSSVSTVECMQKKIFFQLAHPRAKDEETAMTLLNLRTPVLLCPANSSIHATNTINDTPPAKRRCISNITD